MKEEGYIKEKKKEKFKFSGIMVEKGQMCLKNISWASLIFVCTQRKYS